MAALKTVGRWAWARLREPRVASAVAGLCWMLGYLLGLGALIYPPTGLAHVAGPWLTTMWAWLLVAGGILGVTGTWLLPGWWWLEQAAGIATTGGLLIYAGVLAGLLISRPTPDGAMLFGLVTFALALIALRMAQVSGAQTDPRIGR